MADTQLERRKMVSLPQEEFEEILERAAERGARHALHEVGLDGEDAAHDIRELRNLLDAFNEAKKTAGINDFARRYWVVCWVVRFAWLPKS